MTTENREASCEDRVEEHRDSRLADFRDLLSLSSERLDGDDLRAAVHRADISLNHDDSLEDIAEAARERIYEYPLGVSSTRTFRIDLSTGGPGDWLEVVCGGDTPNYEPAGEGEHYYIERIAYHFNDWFDHAERRLLGDDFDTAAEFARQVVGELVE